MGKDNGRGTIKRNGQAREPVKNKDRDVFMVSDTKNNLDSGKNSG